MTIDCNREPGICCKYFFTEISKVNLLQKIACGVCMSIQVAQPHISASLRGACDFFLFSFWYCLSNIYSLRCSVVNINKKMTEVSRKAVNKTRKYDSVKKFGVKKKRWEVENEEIVSLEARLRDLESVSGHAKLGDIMDLCHCWPYQFSFMSDLRNLLIFIGRFQLKDFTAVVLFSANGRGLNL